MMYKHDEETGKLIIGAKKDKKELTHEDGLKAESKILLLIGFGVVIIINCFEKGSILSNVLNAFGVFKFILFSVPLFFAIRIFKKTFIIELPTEPNEENKKTGKEEYFLIFRSALMRTVRHFILILERVLTCWLVVRRVGGNPY